MASGCKTKRDEPNAAVGVEALTPGDKLCASSALGAPKADFIDETVAFWQKRARRKLSREDGREIAENMTGFFRILREWERVERVAKKKVTGAAS